MANPNPSPKSRFKKGQSGNPDGRPVGALSFTSKVRAALEKIAMTKDGEDVSYEQLLVKRVLNKAIEQGDGRMIELIWGYLDGKPAQSTDITSKGERIVVAPASVIEAFNLNEPAPETRGGDTKQEPL